MFPYSVGGDEWKQWGRTGSTSLSIWSSRNCFARYNAITVTSQLFIASSIIASHPIPSVGVAVKPPLLFAVLFHLARLDPFVKLIGTYSSLIIRKKLRRLYANEQQSEQLHIEDQISRRKGCGELHWTAASFVQFMWRWSRSRAAIWLYFQPAKEYNNVMSNSTAHSSWPAIVLRHICMSNYEGSAAIVGIIKDPSEFTPIVDI